MDGVEALARLRADPATASLRVVAVTAFAMKDDRDRFLAGGLRRLHREADQRPRLPRAGRSAAGRSRRSARMSGRDPRRRRPASEHPPARGGAGAARATRSSPQAPAPRRSSGSLPGAIDLVLLDVVMPEMDGYEVCRRVREDEATRFLPVVMITASGEQEKLAAIEAGADDFVAEAVRPARAARARALAAAGQAVPRHDRGAGRRARRLQPSSSSERVQRAGRRARAARPAAPLPVAAARRAGGVLGRRTRSSRATGARSPWCSATCAASPRSRRRSSRRT